MDYLVYLLLAAAVIGLGFTVWKTSWVKKQDEGTERMKTIGGYIADGAMAFLKAEYKVLAIFVAAIAVLLVFKGRADETSNAFVAVSFVVGAIMSALAGFLGMNIATKANVRTTNAARTSLNAALKVAFNGGAVMGLSVVSLGVIGLGGLFLSIMLWVSNTE